MKKLSEPLTVFLALLFGLFAAVPVYSADKINADFVQSDLALVNHTRSALGASLAKGANIDDFLKVLQPSDVRDDRDLGCGIRQLRMALYGGYTTIWINVAVVDKKIVAMECSQSTSSFDVWSRVAPELQKAWSELIKPGMKPLKNDDRALKVAGYIDRKIIDDATAHQLGATKFSVPGEALEESFSLLMSPLAESDVGERCYFEGQKPPGRKPNETLVEADRYDLIRAILRGPSPEGRAYAALALNDTRNASAYDVLVEDKLKKLNVKVHVCHGCIVSTETFNEVMTEKRSNPLSSADRKAN